MAKVLLASVMRPFGGPGEGDSVGAELFHAQVTRAQGPFSLRQTIRVWSLDYIAENIQAPAVVMHYPSRREFIRELRAGDYTHVAINFVVATFHKVRAMSRLIREHAPGARIILGGYGTVLPDDILAPFADAICREEGIGFMRRLLGENPGAPIKNPHAPVPATSVLSYQRAAVVGHVTSGLGCPNGCDFCCTSHFFERRYVPICATGRDIYDALLSTQSRAEADGVPMDSFVIIDEDFFLQKRRALDFLARVREGGHSFSLMGFGSVRGLSQFTAREIAEMGFDLVWNAFEGKRAGYAKQQGLPIAELYRDLREVGCATLTSMIIGFPYQDEAEIRAEFDDLMALDPAMVQILIYFAFPGTPFHRQVVQEERYRALYRDAPDLRRWDGFSMHFQHPRFANPGRVEEIQRELYRADFARLGPTPLRLAKSWLAGYRNLRGDKNPLLAARAERLRDKVRTTLPLTRAVELFGSPAVREEARRMRADVIDATGAMSVKERITMEATPAMYLATRALMAARFLQQPGLLRVEHRMEKSGSPEVRKSGRSSQRAATVSTPPGHHTLDALRLQGGRFTGLASALAESLADNARNLATRVLGLDAGGRDEHAMVTNRDCELGPSLERASSFPART
ncbi:hypothetical protein K8I61_05705 [bacterium]|nr:hypothetical protein [bacterium]